MVFVVVFFFSKRDIFITDKIISIICFGSIVFKEDLVFDKNEEWCDFQSSNLVCTCRLLMVKRAPLLTVTLTFN